MTSDATVTGAGSAMGGLVGAIFGVLILLGAPGVIRTHAERR